MKQATLTSAEKVRLEAWLDENQASLPDDIAKLLRRMLLMLSFLGDVVAKNKELMARLLEFMGLAPKSEKGSQLANQRQGIFRRGGW